MQMVRMQVEVATGVSVIAGRKTMWNSNDLNLPERRYHGLGEKEVRESVKNVEMDGGEIEV